jgi:hypothetical protein
VRSEPNERTREAVDDYLNSVQTEAGGHRFPNRVSDAAYVSTRQYAMLLGWLRVIGVDPVLHGNLSAVAVPLCAGMSSPV